MEIQEGQTATNHKTGQKVVYRGGQWVNAGMAADPNVMSNPDRVKLQAIGMPVMRQEMDPLSRITDPKQRAMAQSRMLASSQTALQKSQADATTARTHLQALDEFGGINQDHANDMGSWGTWAKSQLPTFLQPSWLQRSTEITTGLARGQRIPGEGTISDFDARQFGKMVGGPDKSAAANDAYLAAQKAVNQTAIDRQAFNEAFVQANGTSIGSDRMWRQYVDAQPIFDGRGQVRSGRQGWSDYFAGRAQNVLSGRRPNGAARAPGGPTPAARQPPSRVKFLGFE